MSLFTENGMLVDLEELRKVVDNADVFTIGFRMFPQRLIVDARTTENAGPMIRLVEPVASVEERFFWLGKERPAFGAPERFTFFVWPHSVRYFEESGLADMIRNRTYASGFEEVRGEMAQAMQTLSQLEQQATFDAIHGRNHHTLWERTN
jgi:hypothetical protein